MNIINTSTFRLFEFNSNETNMLIYTITGSNNYEPVIFIHSFTNAYHSIKLTNNHFYLNIQNESFTVEPIKIVASFVFDVDGVTTTFTYNISNIILGNVTSTINIATLIDEQTNQSISDLRAQNKTVLFNTLSNFEISVALTELAKFQINKLTLAIKDKESAIEFVI